MAVSAPAALWAKQWWPVAFASTTDQERVHRCEVLGAGVALWCTSAGSGAREWSAVLDRCPHRLARLSEGRVNGAGHVECPYHGWSFDGAGQCQAVPQAADGDAARRGACATALPAKERAGIVWVWAAPLYAETAGCEELASLAPDYDALEALALDDIVNGDGVLRQDYSRDLPMDATTLVENVLDPSHLPFTHHKTISNRKAASEVPMKLASKLRPDGFHCDRVTSAPGGVTFSAPLLVCSETNREGSFRDWNVVYAVPTAPGRCRLFVRVCFEVARMDPPMRLLFGAVFRLPTWISHLNTHRILEDDNVFLHYQYHELRDGHRLAPGWQDRMHLPTTADASVVAYRRWLDEYTAGKGAPWTSHLPEAMAAPALSRNRRDLLDRGASHTEHCSSCSAALDAAQAGQPVLEAVAVAAILAGMVAGGEQESAGSLRPALAAIAAVAFAGRAALRTLEGKLLHGDYPPPRNQDRSES